MYHNLVTIVVILINFNENKTKIFIDRNKFIELKKRVTNYMLVTLNLVFEFTVNASR